MPIITIRRRSGEKLFAQVDAEDFIRFGHLKWSMQGWRQEYVGRMENRQTILLHRAIMGVNVGDPREVDPIDGNKLNNCRSNLRVLEPGQNQQNKRLLAANTSGYRGVYRDITRQPNRQWKASYESKGRKYHVGYFATAEEADEAIKKARAKSMPYAA